MSKGLRLALADVLPRVAKQVKRLKRLGFVTQVCGSIRRECAEVGDVDIIMYEINGPSYPDPNITVVDYLDKSRRTLDHIQRGGKRSIVGTYDGLTYNYFWIPRASWAAGMLFATGDGNFNLRCRANAKRQGYKLNRYGLYDGDDNLIDAEWKEENILDAIGMAYVHPVDRGMETKRNEEKRPIIEEDFRSKSSKATHHARLDLSTGNVDCTCRGFRTHKHCWHTDQLKAKHHSQIQVC